MSAKPPLLLLFQLTIRDRERLTPRLWNEHGPGPRPESRVLRTMAPKMRSCFRTTP